MGAQSKIEWTDASWNPIRARNRETDKVGWFCVHESEGCRYCYAEGMNRRLGTGIDYKAQLLDQVEIFLDEKMLTAPLRWKKPRKIFVCSMTDLFGDFVPDEIIDRMFAVMALCPQHTFQVLTKRADRMCRYFQGYEEDGQFHEGIRDALIEGSTQALYEKLHPGDDPSLWLAVHMPLPNVWLGTSCEDQKTADARIPHLLATPAAVRFLSCEPLLGPISIEPYCWPTCWRWDGKYPSPQDAIAAGAFAEKHRQALVAAGRAFVDWVIVGGESGPHARPMHPDWARSLRDRCADAGVAFHFKQWGEWHPNDHAIVGDVGHTKVGKARAGRILDGRTHDEFPVAA